jgi:hypothetical protein
MNTREGQKMNRLEGRFLGPMVIREDTSLHGLVEGDVSVAEGVTCLLHGRVAGDLDIGRGAMVELRGMVAGDSDNRGHLTVYGVVRGFMRDEDGGRTTLVNHLGSRSDRDRARRHRRGART